MSKLFGSGDDRGQRTSSSGYLPNDIENTYQRYVAGNAAASVGRSAEMRRLCAASACMAAIYEKERERGGPVSMATQFGLDFMKKMVACLTEFDQNRWVDTRTKVQDIENNLVQFASQQDHSLGRLARKMLPVPQPINYWAANAEPTAW